MEAVEEQEEISPDTLEPKIDVNKALELKLKGLSYRDIAQFFGCKHQSVHDRIKGLLPANGDDIKAYKAKRADIFAGKQVQILSTLTDKEIKKISPGSRVTALGILYDKEALERSKNTPQITVREVTRDMGERQEKIREIELKLKAIGQIGETPYSDSIDADYTDLDTE